jgi:hypothetical protein
MIIINNISAFLWTKAPSIEKPPLLLKFADELLSQTGLFSRHAYKVLHLDGHFLNIFESDDWPIVFAEKESIMVGAACACIAADHFKKVNPILAVSIFGCISVITKLLNFSLFTLHKNSKLRPILREALLPIVLSVSNTFALIFGQKKIAKNRSFFFKCLTINFLMGALLKAIVIRMDSRTEQSYNKYFKILTHSRLVGHLDNDQTLNMGSELSDTITCNYQDNKLNDDVRRLILSFLESNDFLQLRLTDKAWLKIIKRKDYLNLRIKENFSTVFIKLFNEERLLKLLVNALPITECLEGKKNGQSFYENISVLALTNLLENKTLVWGKNPENAIFLCFKRYIDEKEVSIYIVEKSKSYNAYFSQFSDNHFHVETEEKICNKTRLFQKNQTI